MNEFYETHGVSNGLNATEKRLIKELKEAAPEFRLKVAVNLAKSGHIAIVGQSGIPGLFEAVKAALSQENNLSFDATSTVAVPSGGISMIHPDAKKFYSDQIIKDEFRDFETYNAYLVARDSGLVKFQGRTVKK